MINLPAKVQSSINFFQFGYYRKISKKWSDPSTSPKCYWTLLKTLLLNFYWTLLKTPPLQNSVSLIDNGSTLLSPFPLIPEKSLSDVDFSVEDIKNITSKLDSKDSKLMVTIWSVFACLNYVIYPFVNLLVLSSNLA